MKNLEELEKKYAELGKEIQALKENKVKYPIYCKLKDGDLIVKFDGLRSGVVVKHNTYHYIGYKGNNWKPHTDTDIWEQLEVDEETGFYDTQPVWCWGNNNYSHERTLKFYDAKNKCTFKHDGIRDGFAFKKYLSFEGNWTEWMLEAHNTLKI